MEDFESRGFADICMLAGGRIGVMGEGEGRCEFPLHFFLALGLCFKHSY